MAGNLISKHVMSEITAALKANEKRKVQIDNEEVIEMEHSDAEDDDDDDSEVFTRQPDEQGRALGGPQDGPRCPLMQRCREYLRSITLNDAYFDPAYDRCYCASCAGKVRMPDVLEQDGEHGSSYEVPKGWCGFGLKVPARAEAEEVFKKWAVSFHGCPSGVLPSILKEGPSLLMPGDTLIDGTKLPNRLTRGHEDRIGLYTSPSIKYAELDIYTQPSAWQEGEVRTVLQCRQNLAAALRIENETIGWRKRFGDVPISRHFANEQIERFTRARGSIIPYRILVSVDVFTRWDEELDRMRKEEEDRRMLEAELERLGGEAAAAEKAAQKAQRAVQKALDDAEKAAAEKERVGEQIEEVRRQLAALAAKR